MGRMRQPHLILLLLTVVSFSFFIWQHREKYLRPAIGTVGVAKFVLPVYPLLIIAAVQTIHLWLRHFIQSYG